jgi:hypothetical protein
MTAILRQNFSLPAVQKCHVSRPTVCSSVSWRDPDWYVAADASTDDCPAYISDAPCGRLPHAVTNTIPNSTAAHRRIERLMMADMLSSSRMI